VYASQYIAQHRPQALKHSSEVGYFPTLEAAQDALGAVYDGASWQGIRDIRTGQRWIRDADGWWVQTTDART